MEKVKKTTMIALAVAILLMPSVTSIAGDLEPPGPPGPTMKTLDEINMSWHQKLSQDRFKSVLDGYGVLDKETNLVWQQNRTSDSYTWVQAVNACLNSTFGGRYGWRLPTMEELLTVFDPLVGDYPWLPVGAPFGGQTGGSYWTISTDPANPNNAYYTYTSYGTGVPPQVMSITKTAAALIWCVRGGHGYDGQ